jgi:ADP-heptose:LPS heptosyltransferase
MSGRILVVRLDSDGDVLLAGPAVRAVAANGADVVMLVSPRGRQAAELLPGVADAIVWRCPWIDPQPPPVAEEDLTWLVRRVRAAGVQEAIVLTSFHQSALPTALLLRMAGVPRITAASTDYPGSLLDRRLRPGIDFDDNLAEPLRALAVVEAAGFRLAAGDDGRLAVLPPPCVTHLVPNEPYLVLHPGTSVPARAWSPDRCAAAVAELTRLGWPVLVSGGPRERDLTSQVAGEHGIDLGGRTTLAELAGVLAGATTLIVGNTGPAHLAAAVGTPVVSLFAPVVPARRWAPYRVPHVLLGDQTAACRGTGARFCPVPGHPCLDAVTPQHVVDAVNAVVEMVQAPDLATTRERP